MGDVEHEKARRRHKREGELSQQLEHTTETGSRKDQYYIKGSKDRQSDLIDIKIDLIDSAFD